jgi:GntR family transcriptional regulator/MocR family aminotransferase
MRLASISLDPDSPLGLQHQIRQKLFEAMVAGTLPPGSRLPSSRKLADQLGVARNTVFLAYQQLIAEGHIESRERSGLYVSGDGLGAPVGLERVSEARVEPQAIDWSPRIRRPVRDDEGFRYPPDWRQYPSPFIDGLLDESLYPAAEWREASRLALGARQIQQWSTDGGDADDRMLVEEIRTKILPRRGIHARPDEILLTIGVQQALDLVVQVVADRGVVATLEEPGNPEMRRLLQWRGATLQHQPVDEEGLVLTDLGTCDLVYVTPSCQLPTGAVMAMERRRQLLRRAAARDFVIIEDDSGSELSAAATLPPALRSLDRQNRVVYIASLSRVLEPGIRLGFIVAAPAVINEARRLRRAAVHHPPRNNQRAAAFFLALGNFDTTTARLGRIFRERLLALRDALNHYLHNWVEIRAARGGTCVWIHGPDWLDVASLLRAAERRGVLIEPVAPYFAAGQAPANVFRMGVTSLPLERIRPGVEALAAAIRDVAEGGLERLTAENRRWLTGTKLRAALADSTFLIKTVYGDPCTIELHADGRLVGRAGYANEDCDVGRWWVDGEKWYRQWERWAYAEASGYFIVVDGARVKLFNKDRIIVDTAILSRQPLAR